MKTVALVEHSPQWRAWRQGGVGSSDAPVLCGVSRYATVEELWRRKRAAAIVPEDNARLQRGRFVEPIARAAYEEHLGIVTLPTCCEHDEHTWLRASLDGYAAALHLPLEIKAPRRADHVLALDGNVPRAFLPQCLHILLVTGADRLHYASYQPHGFPAAEALSIVEVKRHPALVDELFSLEDRFWKSLCAGDSPPPPRVLDLSGLPSRRIA